MLSFFSSANAKQQPQNSIVPELPAEPPVTQKAPSIRVLETDERLGNISPADFAFDGIQAALAVAFVSPHNDFSRVTSALQKLAGKTPMVAVSTHGTESRLTVI
jgi:hypothetical protein